MKREPVALANDMTAFYPALGDPGSGKSGMVYAANDANFDSAHLSEPLTEYIVGVQETADLGATLEAIAPSVPVGRSFSYRKHDEREAFQSDGVSNDDIREIGGEFALIRRTGEQLDGRTDNKGLTMVIDNDQGGEDPAVQQRAVVNLTDRLLRSEIVRTEALLEANDTEAARNWGATNTTADPDYDVLEQVNLSGDARGLDANIVLFGGGAHVRRVAALRRTASAGGFATGALNPEQLADFYGVEEVVRTKIRFQASKTAKSKVVDNKVYCYYAGRNLMADDPSNIKRFVMPTPDGALRVYVQPALKRTLISVEHYSRIILTSPLGIRKIAVTFT